MSQLFANFTRTSPNTRSDANVKAVTGTHTITLGEATSAGYFDVAIPFDTAFPDANYTALATVEFAPGSAASINVGYIVKSASGVTVRCFCNTGGGWYNQTVTINVAAFRPNV